MTREKKFDSVAKSSAIAVLEDELKIRSNVYAEYIAHGGKTDCGEEFYLDALKMAIAALREQEGKDTNVPTKWISVEDKLPEAKEKVLVYGKVSSTTQPHSVHAGYIRGYGEGWFRWADDRWLSATHWMPLPEPPEVEV